MFNYPLPTRYRVVTEGTGECLLCSEPLAPLRVWEAVHGPVPEGFKLGHRGPFMVPTCVNPEHLLLRSEKWSGTQLVREEGCHVDNKPLKPRLAPSPSEHTIEWEGETVKIAEVARAHGLSRSVVHNRLKAGWDAIKAATEPKAKCGRKPKSRP